MNDLTVFQEEVVSGLGFFGRPWYTPLLPWGLGLGGGSLRGLGGGVLDHNPQVFHQVVDIVGLDSGRVTKTILYC